MVVTGNQLEMQHKQLINRNLIEMGPFEEVQRWESKWAIGGLCYTALLPGATKETVWVFFVVV